jgi:hypothetical protein
VFGPDVTDREMLLSFKKMSNNAYTAGPWYNVDGIFSLSCPSGCSNYSCRHSLWDGSPPMMVCSTARARRVLYLFSIFNTIGRGLGSAQQAHSHGIYT